MQGRYQIQSLTLCSLQKLFILQLLPLLKPTTRGAAAALLSNVHHFTELHCTEQPSTEMNSPTLL